MAGGEIYRVEIPIIVDDQTDKPLKQAEQRISKLEQHARKENERMRQHFMKIARLQIEPVMKVRDHLTSSVSKADRLIRQLDAAQAAPLIDAKDKVSAVVTKINAMLDALDKGKVDVVAEMQGPLLDEIIKAKKSLSELDNVKAGPIADLRGQLFGQLTKAMSQIRGLDLTRAEPQATLRERVIAKVKEIGSSLRNITSRAWNVTLQLKDRATGAIKNIIDKLTSPLALLGAGAGIGAGIFFPLQLAGEFEQAQMSLDFYMGGVEEGKKAFEDLVRFAKETPFEFPFLQGAVIQLMGAGYDFEQAKRALLAFGDAAGRTGAGMQGIEAALLGFTQIASAGTLNLQDLKQVALNLKLPLNIFAKELGVAEDELGNIGSAGISSAKAMEAIVKTLEQRFAGGMKELSNSLLGMTAVIKDTAQLTVWHFGKGMAGPVRRILMDIIGLTEDTGGKFEEFQRKLEQVGEQVGLKFEQVYNKIKEFWGEVSADPEFQKLSFGDKIIYVINRALDEVSAWFDSEGGRKLQETFTKLGEIGAKAWIAGLKGAFRGAVSSAASGNLMGAVTMLGLASTLGGGLVLRGAWGLGKGLFGAGKWALGKLGLGSAGAAAAGAAAAGTAAKTAATVGKVGVLGKLLSAGGILTGIAGVISGAYDIYRGYKEKEIDPEEATKRYWTGGTKIGMVGAGASIGAAIGSVVPGIGTAIGAAAGAGIGGIAALLGGTAMGEILRNAWDGFLSRGREAWDTVTTWASETWENIKERLSSTLFSSEWWQGRWESVKGWTAEKWADAVEIWENTKESLSNTLFSSEWWREKWGNVKSWASEKWDDMKTVWETTKETLSSTLFSKDWWGSKWEDVSQKASDTWQNLPEWARGAWEEVKESASDAWNWIKENFTLESIAEKAGYVVGYLESTIFSGEWWLGKWDEVKNWASEKWATMSEVWENTKERLSSTLFSSEWWQGHWDAVKSWTAEKWANAAEVWENIKESLSSTLFSSEWWQGHWESVKGWTSGKWDEMKTVWETAKETLSSTLFSKDWWGSKWESVKSWADNSLSGLGAWWENVKESFQAGREAGRAAAAHAVGGILTRPHLGLVAEAGPEAIIPLSARMRARALALYEETGRWLGVKPYAEGGFAGALTQNREQKIPVSFTPSFATLGPATINLNFDLTGLVRQVVIENREDIDSAVDKITDAIANNLRAVFQNMTK